MSGFDTAGGMKQCCSRREFVAVAASAAGILVGCSSPAAVPNPDPARLQARDVLPPTLPVGLGLQALSLGSGRDGQLYVPQAHSTAEPMPLLLLLHGAGGSGANWFGSYADRAEALGCVLLAPDSRGTSWDLMSGGFGPDIAYIDSALQHTFRRCAIDPRRIAVAGFSDGASYALSLALPNGDFFGQAIAYSPGFFVETAQRGTPRCFVAHGRDDRVLSFASTSNRLVPRLQDLGCTVEFVSFMGGHEVPAMISSRAMTWLGDLWSS